MFAAFGRIAGFQDTDIRISQCEKAIFDIQNAEHLAREKAEKAAKAKKKRTTTICYQFFIMLKAIVEQHSIWGLRNQII